MRAACWVLVAFVSASACRPKPTASLFPERLGGMMSGDSAMSAIAEALRAERLPVDGDVMSPGQRVVTSTFTVRAGGLGEATVRLRFRVRGDSGLVTASFDAEAQEQRRVIEVGVEDPREPRRLIGAHAINPNDREVIGKVERLLRRLADYGLLVRGASQEERPVDRVTPLAASTPRA